MSSWDTWNDSGHLANMRRLSGDRVVDLLNCAKQSDRIALYFLDAWDFLQEENKYPYYSGHLY
jgi:hypothetical protein